MSGKRVRLDDDDVVESPLKRIQLDVLSVLLEHEHMLNPDVLARQLAALGRRDAAEFIRARMNEPDFYYSLVTTCFPRVTRVAPHIPVDSDGSRTDAHAWKLMLRYIVDEFLGALRVEYVNEARVTNAVLDFAPPLRVNREATTISCESYVNREHTASVTLPLSSTTDLRYMGMLVLFGESREYPVLTRFVDDVPSLNEMAEAGARITLLDFLGNDGAALFDKTTPMQAPFDACMSLHHTVRWRGDTRRLERTFGGSAAPPIRATLTLEVRVQPWAVSDRVLYAHDVRLGEQRRSRREVLYIVMDIDGVERPPIKVADTLRVRSKYGALTPSVSRIVEMYLRERVGGLWTRYRIDSLQVPVEWSPLEYAENIGEDTLLGELIGPPRSSRPPIIRIVAKTSLRE